MKPETTVREASPTARAKAVIANLTALQNSDRLAIHIVERKDHYFAPDPTTLRYLEETGAEDTPSRLLAYDAHHILTQLPMFSSSLLPSQQSGWSMVPYLVCPNYMNNYGYMLNMTQQTGSPPSPRVMRVEPTDFSSGMDYTNKDFKLDNEMLPAIKQFYKQIYDAAGLPPNSDKKTKKSCIVRAMGGPKGEDYASEQLDLLAVSRHTRYGTDDETNDYGKRIAHWNEVISTLCKQQVAAITVPVFESLKNRNPTYAASCKLQAALVGLSHIEQGHDWPVVLYHVSDPDKGTCSYVGQGSAELKCAALEALDVLGKMNIDAAKKESFCIRKRAAPQLTELHAAAQRLIGIDLNHPIDGPDGWRRQVAEQIAFMKPPNRPATPAPAPAPRRTSPASDGRY